jgi:hypothetical protein
MCLRRAPEKYIAGAKAPAGAALDRAVLQYSIKYNVPWSSDTILFESICLFPQ